MPSPFPLLFWPCSPDWRRREWRLLWPGTFPGRALSRDFLGPDQLAASTELQPPPSSRLCWCRTARRLTELQPFQSSWLAVITMKQILIRSLIDLHIDVVMAPLRFFTVVQKFLQTIFHFSLQVWLLV
jgi:hypothetical protein